MGIFIRPSKISKQVKKKKKCYILKIVIKQIWWQNEQNKIIKKKFRLSIHYKKNCKVYFY